MGIEFLTFYFFVFHFSDPTYLFWSKNVFHLSLFLHWLWLGHYWSEINSSWFYFKIFLKDKFPGQANLLHVRGTFLWYGVHFDIFSLPFKQNWNVKLVSPFLKIIVFWSVWNSETEVTENLCCLHSIYWHFLPSCILFINIA